jgi:hypothetical protein
MDRAYDLAARADVLLCVGSSLEVHTELEALVAAL